MPLPRRVRTDSPFALAFAAFALAFTFSARASAAAPPDLEVIDNALFPVWRVTQDVLLSVSGGKCLSWSKVACVQVCGLWQGAPLPVKASRPRDFVFRQPIEPNAPVVDMI